MADINRFDLDVDIKQVRNQIENVRTISPEVAYILDDYSGNILFILQNPELFKDQCNLVINSIKTRFQRVMKLILDLTPLQIVDFILSKTTEKERTEF